jgi:hypothetical protein
MATGLAMPTGEIVSNATKSIAAAGINFEKDLDDIRKRRGLGAALQKESELNASAQVSGDYAAILEQLKLRSE